MPFSLRALECTCNLRRSLWDAPKVRKGFRSVGMNPAVVCREYRSLLLDNIIPFWKRHGVDLQGGGVFSCMQEDGQNISHDKYIWSQARWAWVCAALYNRIEKRPEFLEWGSRTVEFLLAHGRDEHGCWVYRTDREGNVIEGAISIYSDCFAVNAFTEYYRATGNQVILDIALETFWRICSRIEAEGFKETAPYPLPAGLRNHAIPMILTQVASDLGRMTGNPRVEASANEFAMCVMNHFVRPDNFVLEFLDRRYETVSAPYGTFVMPGHAIESMWFVMHWALRRSKKDVIRRAAEVLRKHLEAGWDQECGGLFLGIDIEGGDPLLPHSDCKLWWPHTEALYALTLAHKLTGESWCRDWYERVHDWSFNRFPTAAGEWRQRLDRQGNPMTVVVALPVKDPFHLPRAAILMTELLSAESTGTSLDYISQRQ